MRIFREPKPDARNATRQRGAPHEWRIWLNGMALTNERLRRADVELTATRQAIFYAVGLSDGALQKDIIKWLGRSRAAVTRNLDVLEKLELVRRRPDPDKRNRNRVWLTDWGRRMLEDIQRAVAAAANGSIAFPSTRFLSQSKSQGTVMKIVCRVMRDMRGGKLLGASRR
jgi:DNA-binding MarR family transcriptional regulator